MGGSVSKANVCAPLMAISSKPLSSKLRRSTGKSTLKSARPSLFLIAQANVEGITLMTADSTVAEYQVAVVRV